MNPISKVKLFLAFALLYLMTQLLLHGGKNTRAYKFASNAKGFTQVLIAIVIVIVADVKTLAFKQRSHHDYGCCRSLVSLWNCYQPSIRAYLSRKLNNRFSSNIRIRRTTTLNCSHICPCKP
jgi:hypothetical protein